MRRFFSAAKRVFPDSHKDFPEYHPFLPISPKSFPWLMDGKSINTPEDIINALKNISDSAFSEHGGHGGEFLTWLASNIKNTEMKAEVLSAKSRKMLINILEQRLRAFKDVQMELAHVKAKYDDLTTTSIELVLRRKNIETDRALLSMRENDIARIEREIFE